MEAAGGAAADGGVYHGRRNAAALPAPRALMNGCGPKQTLGKCSIFTEVGVGKMEF